MILSYDMILENFVRTDKQTENSKPEATLIPVDRQGERANIHCVKLDLSQYPGNRDCLKTISKDESTRSLERSAPFQLAPNT